MNKILPIFLITSVLLFIGLSALLPNIADSALKKKKELALLENEEKIIPQAATLLRAKSEEIGLIEGSFPTKKDLVLVAQAIDSLAAQARVAVELHFESEDVLRSKGDAIVPVRLTIEGEYEAVLRFLEALKNGKYLYDFLLLEGDTPKGIKSENKISLKANLYASE